MKKILVVDDNSVSLSLAKSMLSDMYSVFAVLSGEQALRFLEKKDCDLILLDLNMPEMSGYETLREIRGNDSTKDIPIIFLTADSDPETEKKCFEMGAYDFSQFFIDEICNYYWKSDAKGNYETDKPIDKNDHAMDTLKYMLTYRPNIGTLITQTRKKTNIPLEWYEEEDDYDA